MGKPTVWLLNRSNTNQPVQAQKRARSLKFRIYVEEELYYPSSENKGADQLRGYREADLRLCFRICRLLVLPSGGSYTNISNIRAHVIAQALMFNRLYKNYHMSGIVRKRDYCLCENKGADQLRSNCEADQRLCFRYMDSAISLLLKTEISSLQLASVTVQVGLC